MRFAPKTEDEIAAAGLLPDGEYDFSVNIAVEKQSEAGNDMMEIDLHVFRADGTYRTVRDWLVDSERSAYKIRHFAEAVGMLTQYERGELTKMDIEGRSGRCKIRIQKDKKGQYPDKNAVADYLPIKHAVSFGPPKKPAMATVDLDDEIPF